VLFSVHYAEMITYRAEIALWAIATMQPLIMMGIWAGAGESGRFDFDSVYVFRYFIVVFLIRQLTIVWTIHHFEYLVVTGKFSPLLLHPIDPCVRFIFMHLGEQWTRLPFAAVIIGVFLYLYPETITGGGAPGDAAAVWAPGWWNVVLAIAVCYYAFIVRFFMQYVLCMAAFWHERVGAMDAVLYLPYMFLSGLVFPFSAMPEAAREVILWTPFPYMVWFPAAIVVGDDPPIIKGLLIMTFWLILFYGVSRWLWHKGLKHYSAMGA